jgi:hypothetical protein
MVDYTSNIISFKYEKPLLFDMMFYESAQTTKLLETRDKINISEEFSLTEDDIPKLEVILQKVFPEIKRPFEKLSYGVENAFANITNEITIQVNDLSGYDKNRVSICDGFLFDWIVCLVLQTWYHDNNRPDLVELIAVKTERIRQLLSESLAELKKRGAYSWPPS